MIRFRGSKVRGCGSCPGSKTERYLEPRTLTHLLPAVPRSSTGWQSCTVPQSGPPQKNPGRYEVLSEVQREPGTSKFLGLKNRNCQWQLGPNGLPCGGRSQWQEFGVDGTRTTLLRTPQSGGGSGGLVRKGVSGRQEVCRARSGA